MKIEIYQSQAILRKDWRWRAVSTNGRIVADGAEGYASKHNATRAVHRFIDRMRSFPEPTVEVIEG